MQATGDILVVDDDQPIVDFITAALTDEGYSVRAAFSVADAHPAIAVQRPDLMLLDLHLPGKSGAMLLRELEDDDLAQVPIIMMTADAAAANRLTMDHIDFYPLKPFDLDAFLDCVASHVRRVTAT